jgi:hypothetical protein
MPTSGKLKVILLVIAFVIAGGTLWYTHDLVQGLQKREQDIADLYARSLEYVANARAGEGDYSFVFNEIINTIDFPIVMTDPRNEPVPPFSNNLKNLRIDSTLTIEEQRELPTWIRATGRSAWRIRIRSS